MPIFQFHYFCVARFRFKIWNAAFRGFSSWRSGIEFLTATRTRKRNYLVAKIKMVAFAALHSNGGRTFHPERPLTDQAKLVAWLRGKDTDETLPVAEILEPDTTQGATTKQPKRQNRFVRFFRHAFLRPHGSYPAGVYGLHTYCALN